MDKILFKVSSVTNAQRGQKVLSVNGISSNIERTKSPKVGEGCGYMIIVDINEKDAEKILRDNGIRIVGIDKS